MTPIAFVENMDLLVYYFLYLLSFLFHLSLTFSLTHSLHSLTFHKKVKLYESNCNGQLSILDIVKHLAKTHPERVASYLETLQRIAQGANEDDVALVKEIEITCANAPGKY